MFKSYPYVIFPCSSTLLFSYWGQDGAGSQQRLSFYCADDTINVIPLAFLYIFRGKGGQPVVDLGDVRPPIHQNFYFRTNSHIYLFLSSSNVLTGTLPSFPAPT